MKKNWCEYFNCTCAKAKKIDTLGECNHECKTCNSKIIRPDYAEHV
jgi:hypothetical protein